jgi:hypothetical protein
MDKQVEIIKKMTPEQRFEVSMRLYWSARHLKEAAIRQHHPDWTDEQVQQAVKEAFMYARS